jgi:hypothetical protein
MRKLIDKQDGSYHGSRELVNHLKDNQTLAGVFWYSKLQWEALRDQHKDRTFCKLSGGRVEEYTEFVDFDMLADNPNAGCLQPDAVCLGVGRFSHWLPASTVKSDKLIIA